MLKDKLKAFIGSKAMYIALSSVLVGGVAVGGTVAGVDHNRHKNNFIPVADTQTVAESATEVSTENTTVETTAEKSEPSGDKALQYIKEYDKLTAEYEAKKAELEKVNKIEGFRSLLPQKPQLEMGKWQDEEYNSIRNEELKNEYEKKLADWEKESISESIAYSSIKSNNDKSISENENNKKQLEELTKQYEKDVSALKFKYGI